MRHAYGADAVAFGSIVGDGTGQTIAIVDAYDEPTMAADLAAFDKAFGLPSAAALIKINQTGGTTPPSADTKGGWGVETAMDVEWAHAMAPKATILLVEANSANDPDLYAAVDTARKYPGVTAVSMSWGSNETSSDAANNSHFTTPAGHVGVSFFSSSGDNGAYSDTGSTTKIVGYPAVSPNVVAVGGTYLTTASGGTYAAESGWGSGTSSRSSGGSGGGISKYVSQPAYQAGVVTQSTKYRTVPDVAFDADPKSGASIYDAYDNGASTPWDAVGGTSLASPMWAGVMAVANQGRAAAGLPSLDGATGLLPRLYNLPAADFHDITAGNNGYAAGVGYDLVTGRGTPIVDRLVQDLIGATTPQATPTIGTFTVSPTSVMVGTSATLTAANVTEIGGTISTVNFYRESNATGGLQVGGDALVGTGTQTGTTWTFTTATTGLAAGTYTFYAVATDAANVSSIATSATLTVSGQTTAGALLGWSMTGQAAFGTQGLAAVQVTAGVTNSLGLTRGSGVTTSGAAVSNAWGGAGWASTSTIGISRNDSVSFGFTVNDGQTVSLSSVDLNYRRSSTGPTNGYWQYQINGGAWNLIGDFRGEFSSTSASGAAIAKLNLGGIAGLQNLSPGTAVNLRVVPYGATSTGGTWYIYDMTGNDLVISGSTAVASAARPAFSSNGAAIAAAIAKVPQSVGSIASVSVVNFGTTVYTGPLDVTNTINRIRAGGRSIDANDGAIYNSPPSQVQPHTGTWYEFVVDPATGTNRNFGSQISFPGPMRLLLNTSGAMYFTGDHYSTFKQLSAPAGTATPTIGSFTVSPTSVTAGTPATLTAANVTETGGTISTVKFYRESNATSGLQVGGDTLVGTGMQSGTTWTFTAATTGLAAGTYTFYAVATDAANVSSIAASATLNVTAPTTTGALLGWNMTGQSGFGTQGLAAVQVAAGVTNTLGLTRGSGVTTSGTAVSNAWGGSNWAATSAAGISGNQTMTFGLTVAAGQKVSLSALDLNYRRSSTGPTGGYWQYQVNGGAWTLIGNFVNEFAGTSAAAASEISLSSITGLQNLAAGTAVNIRLVPFGASASGGTFCIADLAGGDLVVKGSIAAAAATAHTFARQAGGSLDTGDSTVKASLAQLNAFWAEIGRDADWRPKTESSATGSGRQVRFARPKL